MTPYYQDDLVTLWHGDCVEVMRQLPDNSVDSVVTDPPYELAFMGKGWDASGIAYNPEVWANALRILKPGGHLLAFGGTRTWHRLAVAIEDAGFEVRDSICWLYGSGFPKSLDVSKAIDKAAGAKRERVPYTGGIASGHGNYGGGGEVHVGSKVGDNPITPAAQQWQGWGTALKPAFEPIVVARKPLIGTVAENVLAHGTGALNIDGCRVATDDDLGGVGGARNMDNEVYGKGLGVGSGRSTELGGRWPANVILDESQAAELDRQSGVLQSPKSYQRSVVGGWEGNDIYGGGKGIPTLDVAESYGDTGGASRFFYVPKANSSERPTRRRDSAPNRQAARTHALPGQTRHATRGHGA